MKKYIFAFIMLASAISHAEMMSAFGSFRMAGDQLLFETLNGQKYVVSTSELEEGQSYKEYAIYTIQGDLRDGTLFVKTIDQDKSE